MCVLCDSASWCCISSRKTVDALRTALSNRSDSLIFNRLSHDPRGGLVDVFVRLLWAGMLCADVCIKGFPNVPGGGLGIADQAWIWTHPTANSTRPTLKCPLFTPHQFSAYNHGHSLRRSVQRSTSVETQTAPLPELRKCAPKQIYVRPLMPHSDPVSRQNSIGLCFHSLPASTSRAIQAALNS